MDAEKLRTDPETLIRVQEMKFKISWGRNYFQLMPEPNAETKPTPMNLQQPPVMTGFFL